MNKFWLCWRVQPTMSVTLICEAGERCSLQCVVLCSFSLFLLLFCAEKLSVSSHTPGPYILLITCKWYASATYVWRTTGPQRLHFLVTVWFGPNQRFDSPEDSSNRKSTQQWNISKFHHMRTNNGYWPQSSGGVDINVSSNKLSLNKLNRRVTFKNKLVFRRLGEGLVGVGACWIRCGPLEIPGGGATIPKKKKILQRKTFPKKILASSSPSKKKFLQAD